MTKSLNIAAELIEYLKEFESEKSSSQLDLKDFILWINDILFDQNENQEAFHNEGSIDMELSFLLIMQNKHYKSFCKTALANTDIKSPDEYSFLYHLSLVESYKKMELIHIHLLEAPSGIEVIKRLLKKGFIEEFDDPNDKRAKRVCITDYGKKEIESINPEMQKVYSKMAGNMNLKEKLHVISFLRKLNNYHMNPEKQTM